MLVLLLILAIDTARVDSLFEVARQWAVGSAREEAKEARRELAAMGGEAIGYLLKKHKDTRSSLTKRALKEICGMAPCEARPHLAELLSDSSWRARANAAWLAGEVGDSLLGPRLVPLLGDTAPVRRAALVALGKVGYEPAAEKMASWLAGAPERTRYAAAAGLRLMGSRALWPGLRDPSVLVRTPAALGLGESAPETLLTVLRGQRGPRELIWILAALLSAPDSLLGELPLARALLPLLGHPHPGVRARAVLLLGKTENPDALLPVRELGLSEEDPLVLWAIQEALSTE